jgi:hypothetical protein
MIRTQIQLTQEQARALRRASAARGVSVSHLIRELIDAGLTDETAPRTARARAVVGRFASGERSTSRDHDAALDDTYSK